MYENLKGKKLLVIGSSESEVVTVNTAHSFGVYVIVADGNPTSHKTPAKLLADEAWDINYMETETIGDKCITEQVDGVFAGYSEFRVLAACRIAKYIDKPFYATEEQINLTRNKREFKDECIKYRINVPKDFCFNQPPTQEEKTKIVYPVIVKPTDYGGRNGITICRNEQELDEAVSYALKMSESKTVIVESYIKGTEFAAIYTIKDGISSLSYFNEKYCCEENATLCNCSLTPSRYIEDYIATTDGSAKAFLKGIGAENGVALFQGIVNNDGFCIFEMGYRLNSGNNFITIEHQNGISYLKMLIAHSLTGSMTDDIAKDNPVFKQYNCALEIYAHAGVIGTIEYSGDANVLGIIDVRLLKATGFIVEEDGTTQQKVISAKLCADSLEELARVVEYLQDHIKVTDENGKDMLFKRFNVSRFFN